MNLHKIKIIKHISLLLLVALLGLPLLTTTACTTNVGDRTSLEKKENAKDDGAEKNAAKNSTPTTDSTDAADTADKPEEVTEDNKPEEVTKDDKKADAEKQNDKKQNVNDNVVPEVKEMKEETKGIQVIVDEKDGEPVLEELELNAQEFIDWLNEQEEPLLLDFGAAWCPGCMVAEPHINQFASDYIGKAKVVKLDIDAMDQDLKRIFMVVSVPTFILYNEGKIVQGWAGFAEQVIDMIKAELDPLVS